jgi:hypothetical protein
MAATALLLVTGVRLVQPAGGQQESGSGPSEPAAVLVGGGTVLGLLSEAEAAALAPLSLTPLDGAGRYYLVAAAGSGSCNHGGSCNSLLVLGFAGLTD